MTFDDPAKELPFQGVYRLAADGQLTLLADDIKAPNGIAFSPDEKTLYITDVNPEHPAWLAYAVKADGTLGNRRVFHAVTSSMKKWPGGPDGLKVDRHGNLFAAGPGGLYVFAADGTLLGGIRLGVGHRQLRVGGRWQRVVHRRGYRHISSAHDHRRQCALIVHSRSLWQLSL